MNCTNCLKQFNQTNHAPRLLILCGHSLCQACCHKNHSNSKVQCPQCNSFTYVDSIALLPKNLALLNMGQGKSLHSSNNSNQVTNQLVTCQKHNKKFQAYCEKERMVICVQCILQDGHRNHPMDSIKNACTKQQEKLNKSLNKLSMTYQSLIDKMTQNQDNHTESAQYFTTIQKNIKCVFNEIREIIDNQEEQILSKCHQNYNSLEKKFAEKNLKYTKNIKHLQNCMDALRQDQLQNATQQQFFQKQLLFLQNIAKRESIIQNVSFQVEDPIKPLSLNYTKNNLTENVVKLLEKFVKPQNKSQFKKTQAVGSALATGNNANTHSTKVVQKKLPTANNYTGNQNIKTPVALKKNLNQMKIDTNANKGTKTLNNNHSYHPSYLNYKDKERENQNKEKIQQNNKYQINNKCDVSAVQIKDSLYNSFMSLTSFLSDKKCIYLIGGFSEDVNNIVKLNISTLHWQKVTNLQTNRSKFGAIAIDKGILIFGGKKGKQRVSDGQIWNQQIAQNGNNAKSGWIKGYGMEKAKSGFGVVAVGQLIYFIGGNDGDDILGTVETLNLSTGQWKKKASLNEPRDQLSVVIGNDKKIYAIGGFGGKQNQPLKTVEVYDPEKDKWTYGPQMNFARRALAAATLADGIYAIGGFDGKIYMSSVQKLEQGTRKWVQVSSMQQARCTHTAVPIFDSQQIYVFGGFDLVAIDKVEKYSVITGQWEMVCSMPQPRFMHSSVLMKQ